MGYNPTEYFKKKSTPINSEPIISYDPSIITKRKTVDGRTIKNAIEDSKSVVQSMSGNFAQRSTKLSNMSSKSSDSKSDRVFALQNGIQNKRIKTLKEAETLLGVSIKTVQKYLKELNYNFDSNGNIVK